MSRNIAVNLRLKNVCPEQIPAEVQSTILDRSRMLVPKSAPLIAVADMALHGIEHSNGDHSFLASREKTYCSGETESNTYVIDTTADGIMTGLSEIRFAITDKSTYFKNKPFVGWTKTMDQYRNGGLGRRRLLTMNAASLALYGHKLHSDTLHCHIAITKMWDRLVNEGLAVAYQELGEPSKSTGLRRYKFITPT